MRFDSNYGADPNYVGSTLQPTHFKTEESGVTSQSLSVHTDHEKWVGEVSTYTSQITDEDFVQPAGLWELLGREPGHQDRVIHNLAGNISGVKSPKLRDGVYGSFASYSVQHMAITYSKLFAELFGRVNRDLGDKLRKATEAKVKN
jgi:catalase